MSLKTGRFAFGDFVLDTRERILLRKGESVPIPPKVLDLLVALVEDHGHVVEKAHLMDRLWADTFVEESNLTFSVRKLRQILGDDVQKPRFIETHSKRGYRFIAEIRDVGTEGHEACAGGAIATARPLFWLRIAWPVAITAAMMITGLAGALLYIGYKDDLAGVDWSVAHNVHLTDHPGTEYFPTLAPDGESFAYAADSGKGYDIFHQRVGARTRVNLTEDFEGDDTQPSFSPDGKQIAFRSERDGGGIFVMGILKEDLRRVSDFGFHPTWSPDGRSLAVSTFGRDRITVSTRGDHGIWVIDVDSREKQEVYRGLASFPSWSPNGKRIAYWHYANRSGQSDIATVAIFGGEPLGIAQGFGSLNWNPVWSPDGRFLYFVSNRGGNQGFWRVRIDQETGRTLGVPEPVPTPSTFSRHLAFSRDGSRMIYVQSDLRSNLQAVEFDPERLLPVGTPFWITEGDREVSRAELSPDGTRFQMRIMRRTQDDIVTVSRDGSDWRDVTNDMAFDRYSRWAPDGRRVAFTSDRSGESEIWLADADGANPTQLTSAKVSGHISTFPVWSPDGTRIIFSSPDNSYIFHFGLAGTAHERTTLPQPNTGEVFVPWDWSLDGNKLAGRFRLPRSGAGFFSFESGSFTRVSEADDAVPSWLPDSRHLVYSEGNTIVLLDSVTLEKRELVTPADGSPRSPFVSRDGRLLYWVLHKNESDIWMLDLTVEK